MYSRVQDGEWISCAFDLDWSRGQSIRMTMVALSCQPALAELPDWLRAGIATQEQLRVADLNHGTIVTIESNRQTQAVYPYRGIQSVQEHPRTDLSQLLQQPANHSSR